MWTRNLTLNSEHSLTDPCHRYWLSTSVFSWLFYAHWKSESESHSVMTLCDPTDYTVHGILQARILEWVSFPFSRGSSQPRDRTQVSLIADGFFTGWATREAQEYWSGYPIPSPADLPDPGIEPGSPALQADSLPTEQWGMPKVLYSTEKTDKVLKG